MSSQQLSGGVNHSTTATTSPVSVNDIAKDSNLFNDGVIASITVGVFLLCVVLGIAYFLLRPLRKPTIYPSRASHDASNYELKLSPQAEQPLYKRKEQVDARPRRISRLLIDSTSSSRPRRSSVVYPESVTRQDKRGQRRKSAESASLQQRSEPPRRCSSVNYRENLAQQQHQHQATDSQHRLSIVYPETVVARQHEAEPRQSRKSVVSMMSAQPEQQSEPLQDPRFRHANVVADSEMQELWQCHQATINARARRFSETPVYVHRVSRVSTVTQPSLLG